jgi:hypothetical protein
MKHILKILAVIILITYALKLINAQSDLLVFGGLAIVGGAVYILAVDFSQFVNNFKSRI